MNLSEFSIYTIADGKKLNRHIASGGRVTFKEKKKWVTGMHLWKQAVKGGVDIPVIFADAADCSKLVCWGMLSKVQIEADGTSYVVKSLTKLTSAHIPQELRLRRTGKKIAKNFIRPYAICCTPKFLN